MIAKSPSQIAVARQRNLDSGRSIEGGKRNGALGNARVWPRWQKGVKNTLNRVLRGQARRYSKQHFQVDFASWEKQRHEQ